MSKAEQYGVRLKSTKNGKWIWHRDLDGNINKFSKEGAEKRAALWNEKDSKVTKVTARSK